MFPSDERVNPDLPGPYGIIVSDRTLEELDQELDQAGFPTVVRDQILEGERKRRAQQGGETG